jgi:hypothetical protein
VIWKVIGVNPDTISSMPGMSLSPLTLPWATLKLTARFAVPLTLWYTLGQLLRFVIMWGGYKLGLHNSAIPVATLSLLVMVSLGVSLAMMHSVRDGLSAIKARDEGGALASWSVAEDERVYDALGRALLPFMIFYLAWGWYSRDARAFVDAAEGRGFAEGGLEGQLRGQRMLIDLQQHLYIAIGLTVVFFIAKFICERYLQPRVPRSGSLLNALLEVNWTLYGVFTIDVLRGKASDWIVGREFWGWIGGSLGPALHYWPLFKDAVLGSLVWLVIAGVILGVDAADEHAAFGEGRAARGLVRASGIDREHTPHEVMTRELREKWLPTWFGMRLVKRAGLVLFGTFCALFVGLDVAEDLTRRGVYYLIGPHPIAWWSTRLNFVEFGTGLVFQMLRICLLAAAFNLVVARVSGRSAAPEQSSPASPQPSWEAARALPR